MEKKPTMENTETKTLNISLRKELIKRVEVFCAEKEITVQDFVTDAVIEKIELAYKERRKKADCKKEYEKAIQDYNQTTQKLDFLRDRHFITIESILMR